MYRLRQPVLPQAVSRFKKTLPVAIILKDPLSLVAARHDIIHRTRILNAQGAQHD
jgi:hypothetical protein